MVGKFAVLLSTACLCLASPAVHGWSGDTSIGPSFAADLSPKLISAPDSRGFWAAGYAYGPVLVHYDQNNAPRVVHVQNPPFNPSIFSLVGVGDGGVLAASVQGVCELQRYDGNGQLLWTSELANDVTATSSDRRCSELQLDGAGNIWVLRARNVISPDGARFASFSTEAIVGNLIGDPRGAGAYVFGRNENNPAVGIASIARFAANGSLLWQWQAPASDGLGNLAVMFVGSDGNLYAYGSTQKSDGSPDRLYGVSLTPSGNQRWTKIYPAQYEIVQAIAGPDGSTYLSNQFIYPQFPPSNTTGPITLSKIDSSGESRWALQLCSYNGASSDYGSILRAAVNGDALIADTLCADSSVGVRRVRPDGSQVFSKSIPNNNIINRHIDLQPQGNGDALLLVANAFSKINAIGDITPPPPSKNLISFDSPTTGALGSDGSSFLLSANADHDVFRAFDATGNLVWKKNDTGFTSHATPILATDKNVCMAGYLSTNLTIACFRRSDGTDAWSKQIVMSKQIENPAIQALDNGLLLAIYRDGIDQLVHHVVFDGNGAKIHDTVPLQSGESLMRIRITASGNSLIATSTSSAVLIHADGSRGYSYSGNEDISEHFLAADGSAVLVTGHSTAFTLVHLGHTGIANWKSPQIATDSMTVAIDSSGVYYSTGAYYTADQSVHKLAAADGNISWSNRVTDLNSESFFITDEAARHVAFVSPRNNKIRIYAFDSNSGATISERVEGCGAEWCTLVTNTSDDKTLRFLAQVSDSAAGDAFHIYATDQPYAPVPGIRVDQPGIAGAWYSPYSTGQGFIVDYIAANTTVFMPWFTFTQTQANDPSGNVWYTLQGQPGAGAKSVDLNIYVADSPGTFNSGKNGAKQVGTATLSFADCGHGSLHYQFDAGTNGGLAGTITLTRLTPQASACQLADGSTQAVSVNPPTQGFDARQSGSWYDTNTSGQGMELTVVPAGNGAGGLLFGAWFTYDPAGAGNDPLNQQWFSLQGDLANAQGGKVTVPILQALGGTLNGLPTHNSSQVGTATLTFAGCDRVQVDYQFADASVAHAYAGLSSSLHLTKLGGCATL